MENERLYRTEAVILSRMNIGEADKILTLYSPYRGKLRVVAKGVRKTTSKMGGHVELFTQANLLIARGRNLDIITQSESLNPFPHLRDSMDRILCAMHVVELIDRLVEENDANQNIYRLLVNTLVALDMSMPDITTQPERKYNLIPVAPGQDAAYILRAFEINLLDLLGYRPQLMRCVLCNTTIEPVMNYFSAELGGVICPNCARTERRSSEISVDALKILRYLQRSSFSQAVVTRMNMNPILRKELEQLTLTYIRFLLDRDLKTIRAWQDIGRNPILGAP